jgi:hypothetical protein
VAARRSQNAPLDRRAATECRPYNVTSDFKVAIIDRG